MRQRKSHREQVANWCKYFTGVSNDVCKAGIKYQDVKGKPSPDNPFGVSVTWPCLRDEGGHLLCEKRAWKTDEEVDKKVAESESHLQKTLTAMKIVPEIKKLYKDKNWNGTRECPVCKGVLHLSHAAINGHVWGKCETADCVEWME